MTPLQIIGDFFSCHNMGEVNRELDLLVKIAMTTDNGYYDEPEERENLYFFIENLRRCLAAAETLPGKR